MPYSFTPTINPFVISSIYDSIKSPRPQKRMPLTSYMLGEQVVSNNNRYISIQAGVTGSGAGPSGATGAFFDGSVRWLAMGPDTVQDGDIISNLYVSLGKQTEWQNPSSPPTPDVSYKGQKDALNDATVFIRLDASNLRLGIENHPWTSGTVYSQYDPTSNQFAYSTPHYCIVNNSSVYKCLDNNRGAQSMDPPSGVSASLIETADGYIWKYIGEITSSDQFDFATDMYVPAPNGLSVGAYIQGEISTFTGLVTEGNTFDDSTELQVMVVGDGQGATAAVRTTTNGSNKTINSLYATAGGSNYSQGFAIAWDSAAPGAGAALAPTVADGSVNAIDLISTGDEYIDATVLIIGDGTGARATANVVGGQVTSVEIDDPGEGYTWVNAYIVPGSGGAIAKAVYSPSNGHGSSVITELGARSLLISTKLTPSLNNYIPTQPAFTNGSFRQVGLVSGVVGDRNSDRNAEAYLGKSHLAYKGDTSNLNKYRDGSGFVLYLNNIASITHTSSQEEIIKISISL